MILLFRKAIVAVTLLLALVSISAKSFQNGQAPAGGATSDSAAPKKTSTKPKAPPTKPTKSTTASSTQKPSGMLENIDGKWWTTGNTFGASQMFLEQNGNIISGAIQYADGRTGTFSGIASGKRINFKWTNSSGDGGTGWLEQSWTNFLGGSYRDRSGREGSWTLNRIAGNWCFGGSRDRMRKVNHSSKGALYYVTEDGGEEAGRLEGSAVILFGDMGELKGMMNYKGNRVEFPTGTFWEWCGK